MRLLVIDDDRWDRKAIRRVAAATDLAVSIEEAGDVGTALTLLRVERFDCILLDHQLPDTDGVTFMALLKARRDVQDGPVVMLTGSRCERIAAQALAAGMVDYLTKDGLNAQILARVLRNALIKHHVARRAGAPPAREVADLRAALAVLEGSPAIRRALQDDPAALAALQDLRAVADPGERRGGGP